LAEPPVPVCWLSQRVCARESSPSPANNTSTYTEPSQGQRRALRSVSVKEMKIRVSGSDPVESYSDKMARAKRPRTPISGPYGHPIHPVLVTIPIGTWLASVVFDLIGFFVDDPHPFVI